jgi:mono/diheme cytochrome c family protein
MADKKTVGHAYNVDFLNVVFAASSVFLFISVVWMVWDDYDREWKNVQRRFTHLEMEVTRASLEQAERQVDRTRMGQLAAQREAALRDVEENRQHVRDLENRVADLNAQLYRANQRYQFTKATYDVERYDYEVQRQRSPERARARAERVDRLFAVLNDLNLDVERLTAERANLQEQLKQYTGRVDDIDKEIAEITAEQSRLQRRLEVIAPSPVKTYFRDAPLFDFMAPTLRIQQVITPNIVDDVNFVRVPKMDRCMTCHLAIDKRGYENYPQPYRTHPNLEVYLGSDSPHPMEQIGCTVCHEGMGQSVSFREAYHTPVSAEQQHEWERRFGWQEPHYWDLPMLPAGMTEASCAKCHRSEVFIPNATNLNLAYGLYERAGCYACHKTRGFEDLRKPGPDLTRIAAKLTPEWVETWIRDPRAVKPGTWMPRAWYNSNSNSPEDAVRNEVEIKATVAYLFAHSEEHRFAVASPPRGNAEAGKRIVETVGCLGCHVTDDQPRLQAGPRRTFGQPLQNIGSKTTYEWLFDWVRDPAHYSPGTYMPDLRLTDQQVADVASYLASLEGPPGDPAKAEVDAAAVDAVLFDYLRSIMPVEEARHTVAGMSAEEKQLDLGERVIGRYGCFSCHEIKGFEGQQPIGTELSEQGSKLLTQLDFAFVKIPHTKIDWFHQKIRDPRAFDQGRVLQPAEKLRMPDYDATDEEARLLVTALMSFQREVQPSEALRPGSARADATIAGRNLTRRLNCVGCHVIEGDGGDYQQVVSDPSLAPPMLTPQGAKVQPDWMYAFLRQPITIRPWLDVRMPTFHLSDARWNQIIQYFGAISDTIGPFRSHEVVRVADATGAGRELFELLRCQQCHVLGTIPEDQPTANLAPDLRMGPDRLQADWIIDWLRDPASIQPGTRMPAFWPDYPKSFYPQFDGDAERQILAIRDYLLTLRGGPSPRRQAPPVTPAQQVASP